MLKTLLAVKPLARGLWFHLSLEHFDIISMVDKSIDHGKLLSICQVEMPTHSTEIQKADALKIKFTSSAFQHMGS